MVLESYDTVVKLRTALRDFSYSLTLTDDMNIDEEVIVFKAVMDKKQNLVSLGQFIKCSDKVSSCLFWYPISFSGSLALCFTRIKTNKNYCLVNLFNPSSLSSAGGTSLNNFDCPLYCLSGKLLSVPSTSVESFVSFVHQCTNLCKFINHQTREFERQLVTIDKLGFCHDFTTRYFYYNLYCMNN